MTVASDFSRFRDAYNIRSDAIANISYRYRRITAQLNKDFWAVTSDTRNSLYVGSYGRDTGASGLSDLDVAFALPASLYHQYDKHQGNGQSALLQAVRNSILNTYSRTQCGGDGQVVVTQFDDGMKFEILPVFDNQGGTWTHPDSNGGGSWRTTNPKAEIAEINAENKRSNGNLKNLARMMRMWKVYWGVPISGYLLDTLCYNFMAGWQYKANSFGYHDWMARDFFLMLSKQNPAQTFWRAPGSGSSASRTGAFERKAKDSYDLAVEAVKYDQAGQTWSRRQTWRKIFGPSFPATD